MCERVLEKLIPIEREIQDEEERWYFTRVLPYRSSEDRIEGVVITFVDITGAKTAEENVRKHIQQFQSLVEQVQEHAIFMLDPAGRGTSWNSGVRRVLGFEEQEFVGQDVTSWIFTPEDLAAGVPQAELKTAALTGRANNDRWMRRRDGTRFWAAGMTTALHDRNQQLLGFMKVMRDQTEQKMLEDELKRTGVELADANRRKDEFLATLAHELRNPLAPLRTGVELLKMAQNAPEMMSESPGNDGSPALAIDHSGRRSDGRFANHSRQSEAAEVARHTVRHRQQCRRGIAALHRTVPAPPRHRFAARTDHARCKSKPLGSGVLEPIEQCRQIHASGRPHPAQPHVARMEKLSLPSATMGWEFHRTSWKSCSKCSPSWRIRSIISIPGWESA